MTTIKPSANWPRFRATQRRASGPSQELRCPGVSRRPPRSDAIAFFPLPSGLRTNASATFRSLRPEPPSAQRGLCAGTADGLLHRRSCTQACTPSHENGSAHWALLPRRGPGRSPRDAHSWARSLHREPAFSKQADGRFCTSGRGPALGEDRGSAVACAAWAARSPPLLRTSAFPRA
jgi:hypothetical protein